MPFATPAIRFRVYTTSSHRPTVIVTLLHACPIRNDSAPAVAVPEIFLVNIIKTLIRSAASIARAQVLNIDGDDMQIFTGGIFGRCPQREFDENENNANETPAGGVVFELVSAIIGRSKSDLINFIIFRLYRYTSPHSRVVQHNKKADFATTMLTTCVCKIDF